MLLFVNNSIHQTVASVHGNVYKLCCSSLLDSKNQTKQVCQNVVARRSEDIWLFTYLKVRKKGTWSSLAQFPAACNKETQMPEGSKNKASISDTSSSQTTVTCGYCFCVLQTCPYGDNNPSYFSMSPRCMDKCLSDHKQEPCASLLSWGSSYWM